MKKTSLLQEEKRSTILFLFLFYNIILEVADIIAVCDFKIRFELNPTIKFLLKSSLSLFENPPSVPIRQWPVAWPSWCRRGNRGSLKNPFHTRR